MCFNTMSTSRQKDQKTDPATVKMQEVRREIEQIRKEASRDATLWNSRGPAFGTRSELCRGNPSPR